MNILKKAISKVPIIGGLEECSFGHLKSAFYEWFSVLLFSTLPIWIGAYIQVQTKAEGSTLTFLSAVRNNFSSGELFIYTTAILSPVLFMILSPVVSYFFTDEEGQPSFPSKYSHMITTFVVFVLAVVSFTLMRSEVINAAQTMVTTSIYMFLLSVVLLYVAYANKYKIDAAKADMFRKEENNFVSDYMNRRR